LEGANLALYLEHGKLQIVSVGSKEEGHPFEDVIGGLVPDGLLFPYL
jgi:hypothetical protein